MGGLKGWQGMWGVITLFSNVKLIELKDKLRLGRNLEFFIALDTCGKPI